MDGSLQTERTEKYDQSILIFIKPYNNFEWETDIDLSLKCTVSLLCLTNNLNMTTFFNCLNICSFYICFIQYFIVTCLLHNLFLLLHLLLNVCLSVWYTVYNYQSCLKYLKNGWKQSYFSRNVSVLLRDEGYCIHWHFSKSNQTRSKQDRQRLMSGQLLKGTTTSGSGTSLGGLH